MDPRSSIAVHLVRQLLSSRKSRRMGRTCRTPCSVRVFMRALEASLAAAFTSWLPSPKPASTRSMTWTKYGSNSRPSMSHRTSTAIRPPSRMTGLFFSDDSRMEVMMDIFLIRGSRAALTMPHRPNAAPRLAAYDTCALLGLISFFRQLLVSFSCWPCMAGMASRVPRHWAMDRCTASEGVSSARKSLSTVGIRSFCLEE
mmetsp:Transcript_90332/g.156449  ORF Transcript_90332/g.156449 Transcript_90332/m.156449 type:complete len:200 (-) Transcript_90332:1397-1996(-)